MKKTIVKQVGQALLRIVVVCAFCVVLMLGYISQPTLKKNSRSAESVDTERLKAHVTLLSKTCYPREWVRPDNLERCADYIAAHFAQAGAAVESQVFYVQGKPYRNVIGRFRAGKGRRVVVGAHYDGCGGTPGADDNASGVAGLIELAYLLGKTPAQREVELVAYTLEEPPFFRTESMGSAVHAKSIAGQDVLGVIVLEMIGYFSDEPGSQAFPSMLLKLRYPDRGNFIGLVGPLNQGGWLSRVKRGMKGATDLPVYSLRAPDLVPGIDLSDHASYWPHGINAIMVTDTSFYRNEAYHTMDDTADRLDYVRMAKVVVAVSAALRTI